MSMNTVNTSTMRMMNKNSSMSSSSSSNTTVKKSSQSPPLALSSSSTSSSSTSSGSVSLRSINTSSRRSSPTALSSSSSSSSSSPTTASSSTLSLTSIMGAVTVVPPSSSSTLSEQQQYEKLQKHLQRYKVSSSSLPSSSQQQHEQEQNQQQNNTSSSDSSSRSRAGARTSDANTNAVPSSMNPVPAVTSTATTNTKSATNSENDLRWNDHEEEANNNEFQFSLKTQLMSEMVGTYILTMIGFGGMVVTYYNSNDINDINNSTTTVSTTTTTTTSVLWSVATMIAIFLSASVSGGHLNPVVTLAFAFVRPTAFHRRKIVPYVIAQIVGSFLGVCTVVMLYQQLISIYTENVLSSASPSKCNSKAVKSIFDIAVSLTGSSSSSKTPPSGRQTAGDCGHVLTQCLHPFIGSWKNTGISTSSLTSSSSSQAVVNDLHAFFIEGFGSFIVLFVIFSVTSTWYIVPGSAVPPVVGSVVGVMMFMLGPLTGSFLNPAIEIGRRLSGMIWLVGQSSKSIQSITSTELVRIFEVTFNRDTACFLLSIFGPMVGGVVGAICAEYMQHMT